MSLPNRIEEDKKNAGMFICLAGPRFGGKTTALGTLKGKTLVIDIADEEAGSLGAITMSKRLNNPLDVVKGRDCSDVISLMREAVTLDYENIAIDGLSALTEVEIAKPAVRRLLKGQTSRWDAYRIVGEEVTKLIKEAKQLTTSSNKIFILTVALKEKVDAEGHVISTDIEAQGNVAEARVRGKCPFYVVARRTEDTEGNPIRIIQTKDDGIYGARLDGILEQDNPKGFLADPSQVEEGQPLGLAALITFLRGQNA